MNNKIKLIENLHADNSDSYQFYKNNEYKFNIENFGDLCYYVLFSDDGKYHVSILEDNAQGILKKRYN